MMLFISPGMPLRMTMSAFLCCSMLHTALSIQSIALSTEKQLIKKLLAQYKEVTQHGRPVLESSQAVQVSFGLGLIQMELDERNKALSLSIWTKYSWVDEYLQWDPADYKNLTTVKLETGVLWIPDVMLYNTAETDHHVRHSFATVYHNGTVRWTPHQRLKSSCSIDITNFPFDRQLCHMWFGSWAYTTDDLNLSLAFTDGMDMSTYSSDFKDSDQWDIISMDVERRVLPSAKEHPNFAVLTYAMELRRNLVFSSYMLTLPCVFLACLTLVVFWLPPNRPDRTSLAMSIFGSFLLLLLILLETAPPTASSIPLLGVYYCFNLVIIMLAIFLSSLVVNVCRMGEGGSPVPRWLRMVTVDCPFFYAICLCGHVEERPGDIDDETPYQHCHNGSSCSNSGTTVNTKVKQASDVPGALPKLLRKSFIRVPGKRTHRHVAWRGQNETREKSHSVKMPSYLQERQNHMSDQEMDLTSKAEGSLAWNMRLLSDSVKNIEKHLYFRSRRKHYFNAVKREWLQVACIIDRFFFLLYVFLIVVSLVTIFPRPK